MSNTVSKLFRFDRTDDRDILSWLSRQDNQTSAIKTAIREHLARVRIDTVYSTAQENGQLIRTIADSIARIEDKLVQGVSVSNVSPDNELESEIARSLSGLIDFDSMD